MDTRIEAIEERFEEIPRLKALAEELRKEIDGVAHAPMTAELPSLLSLMIAQGAIVGPTLPPVVVFMLGETAASIGAIEAVAGRVRGAAAYGHQVGRTSR